MKKILLFAAAAFAAMPMMAQDNLILNGDIEEYGAQGDEQCPSDWAIGGAGVWSGRVTVHEFTDGELNEDPNEVIPVDLMNYVQVGLYDWNSYGSTTCSQIVELAEIIPTYTFSYIYQDIVESVRAVETDGVQSRNPVSLWVGVYACDNAGEIDEEVEPFYENKITWEPEDEYFRNDWKAVSADINVPETVDYLLVQVGVNGQSGNDGQGGKGQNKVYMNASKFSLVKAGEGAVNEIAAGNVVNVKYYGIDGVEVVNPAQGQLVIEKSTLDNGAVKVAKKVVR